MPDDEGAIVAKANPTKDFFVNMITKDIELDDCVLDLLDNSIDGALRMSSPHSEGSSLSGRHCDLEISKDSFSITDNCGGIPIRNAQSYAFRFGKSGDEGDETSYGIGLYGIGMKRAMFKLGLHIKVESKAADANDDFTMELDVDKWLKKGDEGAWDFPLKRGSTLHTRGTRIVTSPLREEVAEAIESSSVVNRLKQTIARDYWRFLDKGFVVTVNSQPVAPQHLSFLESPEIKPGVKKLEIGKVTVDIRAGMMAQPPDDDQEDQSAGRPSGWYVLCNDRVVLAADRSHRTGWGTLGVPFWHRQYDGFLGLVMFSSQDPSLLPWTTTKRALDDQSPSYRRALAEMKEFTKAWTEYTSRRKPNREAARELEEKAIMVSADRQLSSAPFVLPLLKESPVRKMTTISFRKPEDEIAKVREYLDAPTLAAKEVGIKAFEYYLENVVNE